MTARRRVRRRNHALHVDVAEQPAGAPQHHREQHRAEEQLGQALDLVVVAELAGDLVADGDQRGAGERAGHRAHPADDEHRQQEHPDVERVLIGVRAADHLDPQARRPRRR